MWPKLDFRGFWPWKSWNPGNPQLLSSTDAMTPKTGPIGPIEFPGADCGDQKSRKPNLATFGQIIYYISSRILKNHSVESRKDLIT